MRRFEAISKVFQPLFGLAAEQRNSNSCQMRPAQEEPNTSKKFKTGRSLGEGYHIYVYIYYMIDDHKW